MDNHSISPVDQTTSLTIIPELSIPHTFSSSSSSSSSVSIIASHVTTSDEAIRITLDKLQIFEDSSLYQLCIDKDGGAKSEISLSSTDRPLTVLEKQGHDVTKATNETRLFIRRRISVSSSLLAALADPTSSESDSTLRDLNDLCKLDDLTQELMLSILRSRFERNYIYTYVGSILIAINPYYFYSIYNPKYSSLYQGRPLGDLPPHVFAIADNAYTSMLNDKVDQAVIISGESGAGKTESTKFLLHQLMELSAQYEDTSSLDLITLGTGPVLEAFGNAKTIANNNSSRFGKFILVKFKENGAYYGASIEKYLLEKSRIISQAPGERNYHVFYYLLIGADLALKEKLRLLPMEEYRYLRQPEGQPEGRGDEATEFVRLRESLSMLKFSTELQESMFTILSAILHIGNITFEKSETGERVTIATLDTVQTISQLLNVDRNILSQALVSRKSKAGEMDSFVTHYKLDEALATCDAMAKALYGALFDWIVDKVNEALVGQYAKGPHKGHTIGVLDIFGFEVFPKNSFEQFCINYANEQLQQYFNKHIFKLEQVEYQTEGIEWKSVQFVDNNDCIDLIAKKPTGLLPLLDEECSFPGADDISLFQKFDRTHKSHPSYSSPQQKKREPVFTINHYASPVTYCIEGFREKNRDLMRQDVVDVLKTSKSDLVRSLIGLPPYAVHRWRIATLTVLAAVSFIKGGKDRSERRAEDWTTSSPAALNRKPAATRTVSSPPTSPDHTSSGESQFMRIKSAGNLTVIHNDEETTSKIGQKLSKMYSKGKDYPDSATVHHAPPTRHPSIAHLLKKKWHNSIRARIEGRQEQEDPLTGTRKPKDKLYKSAPRVKSDAPRFSLTGGKLQQLAGNNSSSRRGQTRTVSAQFHSSLVYLMERLERTHPYFIRCIKSNGEKAPRKFDTELVTRQLQYTGMMETIRIRKAGFPVRTTFEDFYEKYQFLIGRREDDLANQIRVFMEGLGFTNNDIQIGHTKLFMRDKQKQVLQNLLHDKVLAKIILIQKWIRAKLHRCRFLQIKRTALLIQSYARGYIVRQSCIQMRREICSAVIIQTAWRAYYHRRNYNVLREATIIAQSYWRGTLARRRYLELLAIQRQLEKEKRRKEEEKRRKEEEEKERVRKEKLKREEEERLKQEELEREKERKRKEEEQLSLNDINFALEEFDNIISDLNQSSNSLLETPPTCTKATPSTETKIQTSTPNSDREHCCHDNDDEKENPRPLSAPLVSIGRVKSPFLELQERNIQTPEPGRSQDATPSNNRFLTNSQSAPVVVTTPIKDAPIIHKKPLRTKHNEKGAESNRSRPQSDDLLMDSLSDEDLISEVAIETKDVSKKEGVVEGRRRGVHSVSDAEDTLKPPPLISDSGKSRSFEESSELTRGFSPDDVYHVNYQFRHSVVCESNDSGVSEGSPVHEKERFVVNQKRKWVKSPKLVIKALKKDTTGSGGGGGHPLHVLSKIQRITSPMSSGESGSSTPTFNLSPMKKGMKGKNDGHSYKTTSMSKGIVCGVCSKAFSGFLKQGSKCVTCGILIHKHCQGRAPLCQSANKPGHLVAMGTEVVISHPDELRQLTNFLVEKHHMHFQQMITQVNPNRMEPIDRIFQMSLSEFQSNLISNYSLSVAAQQDSYSDTGTPPSAPPTTDKKTPPTSNATYTLEQLVNNFSSIYRSMAAREEVPVDTSDVAIGANQLRTFLDEFIKSRGQRERSKSNEVTSKPKFNKPRRRKSFSNKQAHTRTHKGHKFALTQFKVVTICDQCSQLIPVLAKGEMCQECSFACHDNCVKKISLKCEGKGWSRRGVANKPDAPPTTSTNSIFGAPLENLVPVGVVKVPAFLEKCFLCIENNGIYTQGIYRRSAGGSSKRAVREALEADPESADVDSFSLYAVAATVTSFFRELPEPLLTHKLYNDFIRATDLSDQTDMMETLHRIIDRLPDLNHCIFERLIFNLARIAQQGSVNKMDPHNLAIIFSPSLLQGPDSTNPDQLLKMMPKQTKVIESIIIEQLDKLAATLRGIHSLTSVAHTTAHRLSRLKDQEQLVESKSSPLIREVKEKQEEAKTKEDTKEEEKNKEENKKPEENKSEEKESKKEEEPEVKEEVKREVVDVLQEKERIKAEEKKLKTELKLIEQEKAVLTASLPKLEPFTSTNNPSIHPLVQATPTNRFAGTGREEFLKRQSVFTNRTQKEAESDGRGERNSCSPDVHVERSATPPIINEEKEEKGHVEERDEKAEKDIEENKDENEEQQEEEEEKDFFPDLPTVQVLHSVTKDRVSRTPRRRPPRKFQTKTEES